MQRKRKSRRGGPHSTLSLLRKELREGNLQSLLGGSSCVVSSSNSAPDPLLSSFILPMVDDFPSSQPSFLSETNSTKKSADGNVSERKDRIKGKGNRKSPPMSIKDKEEKAKRSEFVQGLLLSTILDDMFIEVGSCWLLQYRMPYFQLSALQSWFVCSEDGNVLNSEC
ncbi:PROTEIN DEHYDRATION-INDUCED 19-RELATED [Salix purpurea]|uniref:PROTEIN DEHYDRATION-INDUCED 19-RELATED n=1 Tax=Salix purpurea TaxID=77065 RepID=A0A9Q0W8H0_SALPP|nr:PROTEIN DEHYDRATION-INDUCED 19-RELATED [Salix purpurea]